MEVNVKLFAAAREFAGCDEVTLTLPDGASVGQLRSTLEADYPQLSALLPSSMIAVDHDYAGDGAEISAGSEVALIPPVSGG